MLTAAVVTETMMLTSNLVKEKKRWSNSKNNSAINCSSNRNVATTNYFHEGINYIKDFNSCHDRNKNVNVQRSPHEGNNDAYSCPHEGTNDVNSCPRDRNYGFPFRMGENKVMFYENEVMVTLWRSRRFLRVLSHRIGQSGGGGTV